MSKATPLLGVQDTRISTGAYFGKSRWNDVACLKPYHLTSASWKSTFRMTFTGHSSTLSNSLLVMSSSNIDALPYYDKQVDDLGQSVGVDVLPG